MRCPEYTTADAARRWGPAEVLDANAVNVACPWCASWLRMDAAPPPPFEATINCVNLMCPMFRTGGCYWEPYPAGWTEENKQRYRTPPSGTP